MPVADDEVVAGEEPAVDPPPGQRLGERAQAVARERRLLEPFLLGEVAHARLERSEEPARCGEGGDQGADELLVALGADAPVARGQASVHLGERARREPRGRAHRRGAAADREDVLERLLRQTREVRRGERPEERAAALGLADDLDPRVRLGVVDPQVRVLPPRLAPAVVLRLVLADQPGLEDQGLELRAARDAVDRRGLGEQVLDLLAAVAVEVALDARTQVDRLADVQHAAVPTAEQVDARRVRQVVREPDLPEVRAPAGADGAVQVAERDDPEPPAELEQAVEDLGAGLGVGQRPVRRSHRRAEVLRERLEPHVRHVGPDDAPREAGGAHRRRWQRVVVEAFERDVEEREVEPGVVRHEDAAARELRERRQHPLDRRRAGHHEVVDPGQVRDLAGDRHAGVHEGLEHAGALAAPDLHRADLGDPRVGRRAAGGLEVDDHELDLGQRDGVLERGLERVREHPASRGAARGRAGYPNRCSEVKGDALSSRRALGTGRRPRAGARHPPRRGTGPRRPSSARPAGSRSGTRG